MSLSIRRTHHTTAHQGSESQTQYRDQHRSRHIRHLPFILLHPGKFHLTLPKPASFASQSHLDSPGRWWIPRSDVLLTDRAQRATPEPAANDAHQIVVRD
jgi:hypothetical protein